MEEQTRPTTAKVVLTSLTSRPVIPVITIVIIKVVIPVIIIIKVANVILDNDDANDDDGEEFLIEEAPKDPMMSLEPDPEVEVY